MDSIPNGHIRHNGFVRNAQAIAPNLFLVEAQSGSKGLGKVWRQSIFLYNPAFNPSAVEWEDRMKFREVATVRAEFGRRKGQWKATLWRSSTHKFLNRHIEAHLDTELEAVQFMVRTVAEFMK